jgi:hypothetical protein
MKDKLLLALYPVGLLALVIWATVSNHSPSKDAPVNPPPLASTPAPTPTPQQYTVTITPEARARMIAWDTDERDDQIAELEAQVKDLKSNQAILQDSAEKAQRKSRRERTYFLRTKDGDRIEITLPEGLEGKWMELKTEDGRRVDGYIY